MTVATDIICGFPTETEKNFEETLDLCAKYQFPSLFINQFFPRPGTPAALMPRIPANEVKQRTKKLTELFHSYQPYEHKIGEVHEILVTEISHDKKHYVGHNKFYEQVLIPMRKLYMGKLVKVKIIGATKFSMSGEPIDGGVLTPGVAESIDDVDESCRKIVRNMVKGRLLVIAFVFFVSYIVRFFLIDFRLRR